MESIKSRREQALLQYLVRYMLLLGGKMYTVEDILALPDGERAELIDGEMFMMATPTWTHQNMVGWLYFEIVQYIRSKKGKCKVCLSPFGVFLKNDNKNYVEPDISIVCDKNKLDEKGCHGAPDWVLEVVSPSSNSIDYQKKYISYKESGVREYWIVDLLKETITLYDFEIGDESKIYSFADSVQAKVIEGLSIDFAKLKKYLYE